MRKMLIIFLLIIILAVVFFAFRDYFISSSRIFTYRVSNKSLVNVNTIREFVDGDYIVSGNILRGPSGFSSETGGFFCLLDSSLNPKWSRFTNFADIAIAPATEGNIFSVISNKVDTIYFSMLNRNGDLLWSKAYKVSNNLLGNGALSKDAICEVNESGFLFVSNNCILKSDKNGNIIWAKAYYPNSASSKSFVEFSFAKEIGNGNYIVGGLVSNYDGNSNVDFLILKIDSEGNVLFFKKAWFKEFDGYFGIFLCLG